MLNTTNFMIKEGKNLKNKIQLDGYTYMEDVQCPKCSEHMTDGDCHVTDEGYIAYDYICNWCGHEWGNV